MLHTGKNFFDQEEVFNTYWRQRGRELSANAVLEEPVIEELIGPVQGLALLDLGCGNGQYGAELLGRGAKSFFGVDAAQKMLEQAQERLHGTEATLVRGTFEEIDLPAESFDLALSRLALHYVEDICSVFAKVAKSLVKGGRFVLSVEHPLLTSSLDQEITGPRGSMVVDDYFVSGPREIEWLGGRVQKFHHTLEEYFLALQGAGFQVEMLRESKPKRELFPTEEEFLRRSRIPLFLFLVGRKS
ncbi:ubiquinone/menaquinone biosynthesis C-methylase UbiE [Tumebacillus sp. BK434]|uniref:class I SAM-dependent methyltransferase n=1 Tax=Tumebacillus sp. BK434 TaxID=2512169 RepID=UPI001044F00D|nr:class I SAM-dependent methyltransferase [Tumebacillus sp. BK434]TCP56039.1 ubiquinone/menaquinone biosynthesis C-methylase UbiE [Tumebacillus sp. BK434]